MLTFSFSSSFIFKALFLQCQQRWASRMHHEGSDCWESIKASTAEHCVAFQGMPAPLSVITGNCHRGAVRWMQKRSQEVQRHLQEDGVAAPLIKQEMDPDPDGYAYAWNQCLDLHRLFVLNDFSSYQCDDCRSPLSKDILDKFLCCRNSGWKEENGRKPPACSFDTINPQQSWKAATLTKQGKKINCHQTRQNLKICAGRS